MTAKPAKTPLKSPTEGLQGPVQASVPLKQAVGRPKCSICGRTIQHTKAGADFGIQKRKRPVCLGCCSERGFSKNGFDKEDRSYDR